jgi:hypothetical protein
MLALYYLTFSQPEEAQAVAYDLLREKLAVCTNWFRFSTGAIAPASTSHGQTWRAVPERDFGEGRHRVHSPR